MIKTLYEEVKSVEFALASFQWQTSRNSAINHLVKAEILLTG